MKPVTRAWPTRALPLLALALLFVAPVSEASGPRQGHGAAKHEKPKVEAALAASPTILGSGATVTVKMTVRNLSSEAPAEAVPLLHVSGTGGLTWVAGPTPASVTLAPGASGNITWIGRAVSPGTLRFSGQAVAGTQASPVAATSPVVIADLDVALKVTPDGATSGEEVQVEMTARNASAVRLQDLKPSLLYFDGTSTASLTSGPAEGAAVLEPGQTTSFSWTVKVSGDAGKDYRFVAWASAEKERVVSREATSTRGELLKKKDVRAHRGPVVVGGSAGRGRGATVAAASASGSAAASTTAAASAPAVSGSATPSPTSSSSPAPPALPNASLQLIGVHHDGKQSGSAVFSGAQLRDLRILVSWANLSGTHIQRLELHSPDGSLYQRKAMQVSTGLVETRVPVGGTWMTEYSMFGPWRVDIYLDREDTPISAGVFTLTP